MTELGRLAAIYKARAEASAAGQVAAAAEAKAQKAGADAVMAERRLVEAYSRDFADGCDVGFEEESHFAEYMKAHAEAAKVAARKARAAAEAAAARAAALAQDDIAHDIHFAGVKKVFDRASSGNVDEGSAR